MFKLEVRKNRWIYFYVKIFCGKRFSKFYLLDLQEGECLHYSRENLENVFGDITKYKDPYKLTTSFQDL